MTSHDVTDGCASAGRAPAPCEFCAAFFRLKKIKGRFWNPTSRGEEICLGLLRGVPPIVTVLRDCSRVCCSLERMWTEGLRLSGRVTARRSGSLQTGWRCLRGHVQCAADPWHLVSGCRGWSCGRVPSVSIELKRHSGWAQQARLKVRTARLRPHDHRHVRHNRIGSQRTGAVQHRVPKCLQTII